MKRSICTVLLTAVLLGAETVSAEDEFEPIETAEDFAKTVVNRRLVYERGGTVVFLEDGRMGGDFSGSAVDGIWEWREDRVCHHLSIGQKKYDPDCRVPMIDGRKIKFIQEDGHFYGLARIR